MLGPRLCTYEISNLNKLFSIVQIQSLDFFLLTFSCFLFPACWFCCTLNKLLRTCGIMRFYKLHKSQAIVIPSFFVRFCDQHISFFSCQYLTFFSRTWSWTIGNDNLIVNVLASLMGNKFLKLDFGIKKEMEIPCW